MSTNLSANEVIISQRTSCAICESHTLEVAIELPGLPLTGLFSSTPVDNSRERFDQRLLVCPECGHGQLERQLAPSQLYDDTYSFRTSLSATAKAGTDFFMRFLDDIAPGRRFRSVLDLGCNDLHLLERLRDRSEVRVGIDPIWANREQEAPDVGAQVIGEMIESIDLHNELSAPPDLIVCRHTLEHIYDPYVVVEQLVECAAPDAILIFEVPGFDALIRKLRFDQVFHQHLQYLNLTSFQRLGARVGAKYMASCENYHDWGALAVAFEVGKEKNKPSAAPFDIDDIRSRYQIFRAQMATTGDLIQQFESSPLYGYGAAQMLPVLAYHLGSDLSSLASVLDDDPEKQGLYYPNLPLAIEPSNVVEEWSQTSALITAVDNAKPILTRLLSAPVRPQHILYPLNVI